MRRARRRLAWQRFNLENVVSRTGLRLEKAVRRPRVREWLESAGSTAYLSALDLGTTHVKAAVCRAEDGRVEILGQGVEAYSDGATAAAGGYPLADACDRALRRAEDMTEGIFGRKVVPDRVVVGVPASTVRLNCYVSRHRRRNVTEPVVAGELARLLRADQRVAIQKLKGLETSITDPVLLSECTSAQVEIDGHLTNDPIGLRGSELCITVCNTLASAGLLGAIERVVDTLKLDPPLVALQPQCVLSAWGQSLGQDGIGIDVGGRRTTVMLWRAGLLQGLATVPTGGRDVTARLGRVCRLNESQAENLKFAYARGKLDSSQREWVWEILRPQLARWRDAVAAGLVALAGQTPIPSDVWVWGGGAYLNGLLEVVREIMLVEGLSFTTYPTVRSLDGLRSPFLHDRTGFSMGPMGTNVQALAAARALPGQPTPVDYLLRKATILASKVEELPIWLPSQEQAD